MIPHETIETIIQAARIEEVVGEFVTLRRRGVNQIGLCPFHNEKTPSFTVSPAKGIYKCFGCGKAGNAVNFIMEHEHFSYPEALRYLAKKYNIEVEEEQQTPEQIQALNEKESLFNLSQFAQQYFSQVLTGTEEGKAIGLTYLRERGIRDDIIARFQLGFSPSKRDAFSSHALQQGYRKEFLVKTGLSIEKEDRLLDRFHGRVIFPIHSASGRVIGFGGRILTSDKTVAKYVNSPESDIYSKSKTLYGIAFAKNSIIARDNCLLVEGYTDVISLHQAGITNVVASSGTSLTLEQVHMIKRFTPNISILYDGDPAGIKASFRGIDMIVEQGMNVKVVLFPDGEDPDSYARKHHPAEVEAFLSGNAVNFILFKTRLLLDETRHDPIRKAALIKEIVSTIALIPDGISRSLYVKECSQLMDISEQVLMSELNKLLRARVKKEMPDAEKEAVPEEVITAEPQVEIDLDSPEHQEREVIRLLLLYGHDVIKIKPDPQQDREVPVGIADYVVNDILRDELVFENPPCQAIFDEYARGVENDVIPDKATFLSHPDQEVAMLAVNLLFTPYELSDNWLKNNIMVTTEEDRLQMHVMLTVYAFKSRKLDRMLTVIRKNLQEATVQEEQEELMKEYSRLKKQSVRINREGMGRVITR
ncbi:MAG TPA: DNA primase [Bacteroidales bacterium]|nr:DNA primase [Bacteroidales bacterium]HPS61544.1 DNA primase [Bacteroidales bacterium]